MKKLIEGDLSYKIIGLLYKIHNKLGPQYQEKHYQRAVEKELAANNIKFRREVPVDIHYGNHKIGKFRIDFIIENKLVLETKATLTLPKKYKDQLLSYMSQLQIRVGIISNFKHEKLWIKRLLLPDKYIKKKSD